MEQNLSELIDLEEKDIISVVGSGGKTTFIYTLAEEIRTSKVMVSTTTKMFYPNKDEVDRFCLLNEEENIKIHNGITFIGEESHEKNKVGCSIDKIKRYSKYFDYVLLEGDGSKRKPLKGWNEKEPVIIEDTTKTIGIIPINLIGDKISESNIHRIDIFKGLCKKEIGDEITVDVLAKIICNEKGLFKNSKGEKILFLNKIENSKDLEMAWRLLEKLMTKKISLSKVLGGSLKKKIYYGFFNGGDGYISSNNGIRIKQKNGRK
ncbi:selenium cofactor biosynthesis protein YqeC [Eubacterium multiforme]|uniref:Selenium-dependent hydroxylase accessory protein YqeC n=1 Tax=Eubacterium multiforme TaxID=83339 RepID=A0ABT9UT03_9FIRM|nr:selenium cofactor biosynthesis protein YqeC [Eubacterium multiforme]MDQ0149426.1 putative selenium-dependent hydroxylase accessory protein YqeC [Eubacterium multiforme]